MLMLMLMSQFSLKRKGATLVQAQAQGSQPYRPPSCLTSREAGIENSVKKWSSARASVLVLIRELVITRLFEEDPRCLG